MNNDSFVCPGCGTTEIMVYYTAPLMFECKVCNRELIDENAEPAIRVLTKKEAHSKRPGLYGKPSCPQCSHGVHDSACKIGCQWCKPQPKHQYKFRLGREI